MLNGGFNILIYAYKKFSFVPCSSVLMLAQFKQLRTCISVHLKAKTIEDAVPKEALDIRQLGPSASFSAMR